MITSNIRLMEDNEQKPSLKFRLGSMLLDHAVMTFAMVPIMMIFMITSSTKSGEVAGVNGFAFYALLLVYINKDLVNGRSVAKRVLGFQVIDRKTGNAANELQCLLRNVTIPILWPLEVLITLFSRQRRIGDMLANTRVEVRERVRARTILEEAKSLSFTQINLVSIIVSVSYVSLLAYLMAGLLP